MKKVEAGAEFFNEPTIRVFDFKIPQQALRQLNRSGGPYVAGEITEGEHVLANVGIRLKGMGSFRTVAEKPSFAVKFDEFAQDQTYRGIKKLMFNNSAQDSTYLAELLATQLFRDAGVPAARVTHARVRLNGRDLGLYVVIDAMNKRISSANSEVGKEIFTKVIFKMSMAGWNRTMERQTQADVGTPDACAVPDQRALDALEQGPDADRFLSFIAMNC